VRDHRNFRPGDFIVSGSWIVRAFVLTVISSSLATAGDWDRFRGPNGLGVSTSEKAPSALDPEKNRVWHVECPQGISSPIVSDGKIFLTGEEGDNRFVFCVDAKDGKTIWTQSVSKTRAELATKPNSASTPTAAVDDKSVYAFFPDFGLVAYSHQGEEKWKTPLGPFHSFHGISSSPIVVGNHVIVLADQLQDSFLAGYDRETGKEVWKVVRQDGAIGGYSTPTIRKLANGEAELIVTGPFDICGVNPATGKVHWSMEGATNAPISAPVLISDHELVVCEPSFEQNPFPIQQLLPLDTNKDGKLQLSELEKNIRLFRIGKRVDQSWGNSDGEVTSEEIDKAFARFVGGGGLVLVDLNEPAKIKWSYKKTTPHVPSTLLVDDVLYFILDGGIFNSVNLETGEIIKKARVEGGKKYYASPVTAAGKIYLADIEGNTAVIEAAAEWKVLSTTSLGEPCYATPAIVDGRVYIRTAGHLSCFAP
jgi:outer membrane protein assembly factor BamB